MKFPDFECFRSTLRGLEEKTYIDENGEEKTTLVGKNISKEDYEYALMIYNKYCKNFKDYHDLYMQTDIILLCDIFEEFADMCHRFFEVWPQNYFTAPGYAWDALLLFNGAKLEPLVDEDMYIFLERGIRGDYSNVHKRYSKANHKYLPDFDTEKIKKFLIYWDFNSMYATAMLEALPYCGFR